MGSAVAASSVLWVVDCVAECWFEICDCKNLWLLFPFIRIVLGMGSLLLID